MKDALYPSVTPVAGGELEYTDNVTSIATLDPTGDYAASYYMGYLNYGEMPENQKLYHFALDSGSVHFEEQPIRNHGWGFCILQSVLDEYQSAFLYTDEHDALQANSEFRFINKVKMCNYASANTIDINFRYVVVPTAHLDDTDSAYNTIDSSNNIYNMGIFTHTMNITDNVFGYDHLVGWMSGQSTIPFSITVIGETVSVDLQANWFEDSENHTYKHVFEIGGISYTAFIQIAGANYPEYGRLLYSTNQIYPVSIAPFIEYSNTDENYHGSNWYAAAPLYAPQEIEIHLDFVSGNFITDISVRGSTFTPGNNVFGNYYITDLEASADPVWYAANSPGHYPGVGRGGLFGGCHITESLDLSQNYFGIFPIWKPSDIWKSLSLFHKIDSSGMVPAGVTPINTYTDRYPTSLFTDNCPQNIRREGDLSAMTPVLMLWQMPDADITVDEFDIDDIPPYDPNPPGEDGDGDTILPPDYDGFGDLSGFVTMYALKADHIANLGSKLWASFTDSAFWESVSAVLTDTTSIDPSVILNYIVSVRLYPFDLSTVKDAQSDLPSIYFGRGLASLLLDSDLTNYLYILKHNVTRVNGGQLKVPAKYGDFRDMEPCAKMILHVPFAGSCEINPSQVIGKYLSLSYSIDYCTGAFMTQCFVSGEGLSMSYPVATLYGQLGATVQLSASNEMEALQCLAGATMGIASGIMGNPSGLLSGTVGVASSLSNNRTVPHTTGKSSGFSSFYEPRVPYIEIIYDQYYKPSNYAHTHGNACNMVSQIGDLHGYTVCRNVDTTGLTCETDERLSIKRILESGFFVD